MVSEDIVVNDVGLLEYDRAYRLQMECVEEVLQGGPQRLIFCEHPPVLTLGRMTKPDSLLWTPEQLRQAGVSLEKVDRGGDVTLHAPGQLVVYPILDLNRYGRDLHLHLRRLEDVAIGALQHFGVAARREPGQTGVWAGKAKVVSLGIGVKRWVSYHGIGINVSTDLSLFGMIKPCGLNVEMQSISHIIGRKLDVSDVVAVVRDEFMNIFVQGKGVCHGTGNTS